MAAPRLFGRAVIYGIGGTIAMYGETLSGTRILQSQTLTRNFDAQYLLTQTNEVDGIQTTKQRKEIAIEFVPCGASGSSTVADAKNVLTASLVSNVTKVTVSNCNDGDFNGTYAYVGGATVRMSNDNYAIVGMNLVAWDDVDMTFITTLAS